MELKEVVASQALTKALTFQSPVARNNLERLRRVHPDATPTELAKRVTRYYLSLVTTSGGAMGAAGTIPGGGLASAAFDVVAFTEASVLYALTLAEIHGIHPEDIERRRLLVQTILIGDSAITALNKGAGRTVPYWGKQIVNAIPYSAVLKANKVLGPRFITKYGTKQGVLVLSKQIPLGLGIGVGAFANHMIGRTIVGTARKVLGPAPEFFEPRPDSVVVGAEWVQAAGIEAASQALGHSNLDTTLGIYGHQDESDLERAMETYAESKSGLSAATANNPIVPPQKRGKRLR